MQEPEVHLLPSASTSHTASSRAATPTAVLPRRPLRRQVHPDPPRREPDPILLEHIHPGVVSLEQRRVRPLRLEVGNVLCDRVGRVRRAQLSGCGFARGRAGGELCADALVQW